MPDSGAYEIRADASGSICLFVEVRQGRNADSKSAQLQAHFASKSTKNGQKRTKNGVGLTACKIGIQSK